MTPIDKPSCMPDRDSLPEAITSCSCDLVEFYDEFLEGRTDASFAECKIMFRFGYAMFKTPEVDRNREDLLRLKKSSCPCCIPDGERCRSCNIL